MKRLFLIAMLAMQMVWACTPAIETPDKSVVVLPDGPVVLQDTQFGMYYGNANYDGIGVFSLVLSDARCYQDELGKPYMDSEGDMLVLSLKTDLLEEGAPIAIPTADYPVAEEGLGIVDAVSSYVTRFEGNMQTKWNVVSGVVSISSDEAGEYEISTSDLVISRGEVADTVEYVFKAPMKVADYMLAAPGMTAADDDIIDMPFPILECIYNGDLFGNGTGNFVVNLSTKDFVVEGEVNEIPGIYITLNFFSRLYSGAADPVLEEGRYTVSTSTSNTLLQRWSLLPGLYMDSTPFGSYILQIAGDGTNVMEFITSGVVDVDYEDEGDSMGNTAKKQCTMTYNFKTSGRTISGVWKGEVSVENQAEGATDSYLTTLDHDVDCDMSKVTSGNLRMIEVLHRDNVEEEWDYDIAEAWQLYLEPRGWNDYEMDIPWNQDENNNGIKDRLEAWCADGDVMILEFILPLGSNGVIAPELNKTYTYTMQPSLAMTDANYEIYVSRMGRPADEIFDPEYARQHYGWAEGLGITSYDRCNARRGFTWSTDGWRGNWYMHYETGNHQILDEHAPAVNGWVKVTRTSDNKYNFEWEFIDDNPGTPNKIKGSIEDCTVYIR